MTSRPTLLTAVLTAVLASPTAAQRFRVPDSLAYLGMPDDPLEYVRKIERELVDGLGSMDLYRMYEVGGCASDGGWTTVALDAMYRIAETDIRMRDELASEFGGELRTPVESPEHLRCPSDIPSLDAWLNGELRREWESGALSPDRGKGMALRVLFRAVAASRSPATQALVRDIAFDRGVRVEVREQAVRVMESHMGLRLAPLGVATAEEQWERRLDIMEVVLREYSDDLPRSWVLYAKDLLQFNGRIIG